MNKYLKEFLHRGLMFGGFGPIVVGIVYAILSMAKVAAALDGGEVLIAIVSSYLLAFIQAGVSVFNQIEHWSVPRALFCHFTLLFAAYSVCYLTNSWIPFEPMVLLIFAAIFIVVYAIVWLSVYLSVKTVSRKLNSRL